MTDKEKQDKIQQYEREIFFIEMKDRLDHADRSLIASLRQEIRKLEK